jgi:uncharacterized membrane protein YhaH (DUF805 family)
MDLTAAVKSCLRKYVTFSGRAPRSEYWFFVLAQTIAMYAIWIVTSIVGAMLGIATGMHGAMPVPGQRPHFDPASLYIQIPGFLFGLALLLPSISVGVRRLHDIDRSGWWWWLNFIPLVGTIWLLVWQCSSGTKGCNRFGANPLPPLAPGEVAMIEPVDAIKKCLANYATFRGRASRAEFWFFALFIAVVTWIVILIAMFAVFAALLAAGAFQKGAHPDLAKVWEILELAAIPLLALYLPRISVSVRRLHDTGRSGWHWWLYCVPLVGLVLFMIWNCERGTKGANRFGPDPLAPPAQWPIASA